MTQSDGRPMTEETRERIKITVPVRVNWALLALYTVALAVWVAMFVLVLSYLFRGLSSSIVLTVLLLLWMLIWLGFGRFLWGRWQYHAASREILFLDDEQLTIRRPVSIFGLTTSYDLKHLSQFYYSEKHHCPAFDYAYLHVYFSQSLPAEEAKSLVRQLNAICFPNVERAEES